MTLIFCDPGGLRSHSPHIKSMVLSRLSYEVFCGADGLRPVPLDFQSSAMTTSTTAPYFGCMRSFEIPTCGFTNHHSSSELHTPFIFVTPVGFEPTVFRLKVGGLDQLSYEVKFIETKKTQVLKTWVC